MSDGHVISFHLKEILEAFNAPIKFDQAWALVFVYLSKVQDDNRWDIIDSLQQIFIHQEGVSVQNISDQDRIKNLKSMAICEKRIDYIYK